MSVLIDNRAGSRDLHPLIPSSTLVTLPSADVAIPGNGPTSPVLVGIEIKTVRDFISSADSGRFQDIQVRRMLDDYHHCWVAIYGPHRCSSSGMLQVMRGGGWRTVTLGSRKVPFTYFEGLITEITVIGFHVRTFASISQLAAWVRVLERWWGKPWEKHKAMQTFHSTPRSSDTGAGLLPTLTTSEERLARVAAQLPGMGWKRATAAARHFPSILAMMGAGEDEWRRVDGVGKVVAEAVVRSVRNGN